MTLREKIIQLLEQGTPMLSMDIAKRLGVKKPSASKATKDLHNQGLLHIVEWDGGNKFYAAGSGKDAIKPDAKRAYDPVVQKTRGPFKPHADVAAAWMMTK